MTRFGGVVEDFSFSGRRTFVVRGAGGPAARSGARTDRPGE
jgi:hypothetical protein